jgi:hypothetical protein
MLIYILALGYAALITAHDGHEQKSLSGPHQSLWYNTLPGDGGTEVRSIPAQATWLQDNQLTVVYRLIQYFLASLPLDDSPIPLA